MASEEVGLVPTAQRINNSLNPQLLFQEENPLRFNRAVGDPGPGPGPKTRELGGFMDDKMFSVDHRDRYFSPEYRRSGGEVFGEGTGPQRRSWNGGGPGSTPSSGEDEDDDDDDDDEVEDDEDDGDEDDNGDVEGLVGIDNSGGINRKGSNSNSSGGGGGGGVSGNVGEKVGVGSDKNHATFGSPSRQVVVKDGSLLQAGGDANRGSSSENGQQQGRVGQFQKMVTIAEHDGEMYYSQLLQGTEGSSHGHKDISGDNGCGFSGRKEGSVSCDPGESLRAILSDPITGALMDDAMILPCGHSFGRGGIQQVIKMKACSTCSHPVSEDSVAPNLSLRVAVQAFLREEDMQYRAAKRRRERFEQEKGNYSDSPFADTPRARGVHFPFAVTDRVIIKGNKRTPQRFVGREAIVTTQCLNGWYVVKTLDNAESVKLQYRSLEKVSDNPSSKPTLDKLTPNWLSST